MPVFALQRKFTFAFEQIDAIKFAEIWNKLDVSQTGNIQGNELDTFFYELSKSLLDKEPTQQDLTQIKNKFNATFGTTDVISMEKLAKILLSSDEHFFLIFRQRFPLKSSVTFMQIWRKYDLNKSGYINVQELQKFIGEYIAAAGCQEDDEKIEEYAQSIMLLFDHNRDGLLDLYDMAKLLSLEENFLLQFKVDDKKSLKQRKKEFDKIFQHYDQSRTGTLEGAEVDGFLKDMIETIKQPIDGPELQVIKETLLNHLDINQDGKLQRSELALCFEVHRTETETKTDCCYLC